MIERMHEFPGYGPYEVKTFDSVDELARTSQPHKVFDADDRKFVGRAFTSFDDARQAANAPWPEGVRTIDRLTRELSDAELPMIPVVRRRPSWSEDDGDEVCIDRVRLGRPHWRTTQRQTRQQIADLVLVIDVTASHKVRADQIFWRGAAGAVLAQLLERAGHRVEIWLVNAPKEVYTDNVGCMVGAQVKKTTDPLDLATLANATSGWFFRTMVFGHLANSSFGRETEWGLGYPVPVSDTMLRELTGQPAATLVAGVWSYDAALLFVRQTLKRFSSPQPA